MSEQRQINMLCIATYLKGDAFLRQAKRDGCHILLVTLERLRDADWPRDAIDEIYFMPNEHSRDDVLKGISYLARSREIHRIVPLDEFDQETAAMLREHLRVPGMGETTARYFRDKLAMRVKAHNSGLLVPDFVQAQPHLLCKHNESDTSEDCAWEPAVSGAGSLRLDQLSLLVEAEGRRCHSAALRNFANCEQIAHATKVSQFST